MTLRRLSPRLAQQPHRSERVKSPGEFASPATGGPRFYVREHEGYAAMAIGRTQTPTAIEIMVIDRDYCHRVIKSYRTSPDAGKHRWSSKDERRKGAGGARKSLDGRRRAAAALCAELNAWHTEQMQAVA